MNYSIKIPSAAARVHTVTSQTKKRPSILCVDDHKLVRDEICSALARNGWDCECANDGEEAMRWLSSASDPVDILITDHSMPGMNGLDLVRKLRATKFAGKILVHTTLLLCVERAEYMDLRVDVIVPKTGNPGPLIKAIKDLQGVPT
jgi:DNA-binding response OmpR family regulator